MDAKTQSALAIAVQMNVPVLLTGNAGIGKTAQVRYLAELLGWNYHEINPSASMPEDLAMPTADHERGVLKHLPWEWLMQMKASGKPSIFCVDEFNTGSKQMEAALMKVILEGKIGSIDMGPQMRRVAIMNPSWMATNGTELSGPTANRFCHLEARFSYKTWRVGQLTGTYPMSMPIVPANWPTFMPQASSAMISFLDSHGEFASVELEDGSEQLSQAWASPRTWDFAKKLMAACFSLGLGISDDVTIMLVRGLVGHAIGDQFVAWSASTANLPTPEQMWAAPMTIGLPNRDDMITTVLNSLVAAMADSIRSDKLDVARQNWAATWKIINRVAQDMGKRDLALGGAVPLRSVAPANFTMPPEAASLFGIAVAAQQAISKRKSGGK
jgi:hypothetical protein